MKLTPPPPDTTPASLLALAKEWRPRARLAFRLGAAPGFALYAQAVPSSDLVGIGGSHERIARIVTDSSGEQVADADTLRLLDATEWRALLSDVAATASRACPTYRTHDVGQYLATLQQALREDGTEAARLVSCFDPVRGATKIHLHPRPDRYWGRPMAELLDLHLMLFQAAHRHFKQ